MSLSEAELEQIADKEKRSNMLIKAAVNKVEKRKYEARHKIEDYMDAKNIEKMFNNLEC